MAVSNIEVVAGELDHADRLHGGDSSCLWVLISDKPEKYFDIKCEFIFRSERQCLTLNLGPFKGHDREGRVKFLRIMLVSKSYEFKDRFVEYSEQAYKVVGKKCESSLVFDKSSPAIANWVGCLHHEIQRRSDDFFLVQHDESRRHLHDVIRMPLYASAWLLRQIQQEEMDDRPKKQRKRAKRKGCGEIELTTKQLEAFWVVMDSNGNIAEAARRLGKSRKTVDEAYQRACEKLGKKEVARIKKQNIPHDRRGQSVVVDSGFNS